MSDEKKYNAQIAPADRADQKLKSDDKQARLAEALRANLRRRKDQARGQRDQDDS